MLFIISHIVIINATTRVIIVKYYINLFSTYYLYCNVLERVVNYIVIDIEL